MPIASFCATPSDIGVLPFYDGQVVLVTPRVRDCFTLLTYGLEALSRLEEGDTIWVGHELARKTYFKRSRVTNVEQDAHKTRIWYGEYFTTFCKGDPERTSLDGAICVVRDEIKLRELLG